MAKTTLVNSWFCPFAQRAWIALLRKGVAFDLREQDPYDKSPDFLALNPRGLVPVIVDNGCSVYESSICVEFVDENWDIEPKLLPANPFERARARIWGDYIEKNIIPKFYGLLLKPIGKERLEASSLLLEGLSTLVSEMSSDSPFFFSEFGYVDIMLAPFALRFEVILKHYRDFHIPTDGVFVRYHTWWQAVRKLGCVKATFPNEQKLVASYERYADGSAGSLVAKAVKDNKALP